MAGYNQGYGQDTTGTRGQNPSNFSSYNAVQDEFGQKEGNNNPSQQGYGDVSETVPPHHRVHNPNEPLPKPTGYGTGTGGYGGQPESYQDAGDTGYRATGTGVGGGNTGYGSTDTTGTIDRPTSEQSQFGTGKTGYGSTNTAGTFDRPTSEQSQFGTGKTGYGTGGVTGDIDATRYGGTPSDTSDIYGGKTVEPGYGEGKTTGTTGITDTTADDATPGYGADTSGQPKKEGFVAKLMDHMPGHHKTQDTTTTTTTTSPHEDTSAPPKKGVVQKIKEKLPGSHE